MFHHRARALAMVVPLFALGADWPQFRGPRGDGIADAPRAPVTWSATENVVWKASLPRPGNGSPIVAAGRVFVTSAEDAKGLGRSLYCFDAQTGKQAWARTINFSRELPTHKTNPYCATTPACDGERVLVWHGSAGLHCYSLEGETLWSRDLGEFVHAWGYASSPVIYRGKVILCCSPGKKIFVTAIDAASGQTLWEVEEPQDGDGQRRSDGGYMGSWSTPFIASAGGRVFAICTWPTRVAAYDVTTGEELWSCRGVRGIRGDLAYSSPVVGNGICLVTGGYNGPSLAVRIDGRGDVTESARLWRIDENPQSIGSGVVLGEVAYLPYADPGILQCVEIATGMVRWKARGGDAAHWGSVVAAGELLYVTNQNGDTIVFRPNPEQFDLVAVNKLGDSSNATPAIAEGRIFIRTSGYLWCIGQEL